MNDKPILPAKGARSLLRNQLGLTLVLWVVLILMFLIIWAVLQPPEGARPQVHAQGSAPSMTGTYAVTFGVALVIFLVALAGGRRFNAGNSAGVRALAEGDFARAETEFSGLQRRFRWNPIRLYAAVARFNLAIVWLYQGRFAEAIDRLGSLDKGVIASSLRPHMACYLALAYGLRGQIDPARAWLAEADKRAASAAQKPFLQGLADLARAVVDLRSGDAREAHRWIEDRWRGLEGSLTGASLRPFTVVRAFAAARAGGEREAGASQRILHGLLPIRAGEFAMLEAEWPEMHAFLADA